MATRAEPGADMAAGYCFYDGALPEWGIAAITLAHDAAGDLYFPVRPLCDALAVDRASQAAIIRSDSRLRDGAREIRMPTRGGPQAALCLRKREVAIWLAIIDPDRIGPRAVARGKLREFQAALWQLADRIAFRGKASADASAIPAPIVATLAGTQRAHTHCPDCGVPLLVEVEGGEMRVSRE